MNVSLDDIANDGALLEGDNNRSDVEGIEGTNGDDRLTAPSPGVSNDLFGLGGADTLNTVDGTPANDAANGGEGIDTRFTDAGDFRGCEL